MSTTLRARVIRLAHADPALRPHLLPLLRFARTAPPGLGNVWPDSKDKMRIQDMANKAKDRAHMLRLAAQMAKAITDAGKAFRRGAAAEAAGYADVAKVFYDRCDALTGFKPDDAEAEAQAERDRRFREDQKNRAQEKARAEERARAEEQRRREEEARRRRQAPPPPSGGGSGGFSASAIRMKIESVKRLRDGATTPGERAAAQAALERLELRLKTMRTARLNPRLAAYLNPILRETWED
jgi:hypothetical protein